MIEGLARPRDPDRLDRPARLAQPRRVRQRHAHAGDLDRLAHPIARGPRLGGHDRALLADQRVEQRGLSDIGPPDQRDAHSLAHRTGVGRPLEERGEIGVRAGDGGRHRYRHLDTAHVLREVHARFDFGRGVGDALGQRLDPARQRAAELRQSERASGVGLGVDQIGHRLGLREVEPAAEEGAQRELAGGREARARGQQGRQHAIRGQPAAVAGELHHVLAGVRARSAEHGRHHLVERRSGRGSRHRRGRPGSLRPHRPTVMQRVAPGRAQRSPAAEHSVGERDRAAAAHPHHGEPGRPGRGGDGGDIVIEWMHVDLACKRRRRTRESPAPRGNGCQAASRPLSDRRGSPPARPPRV